MKTKLRTRWRQAVLYTSFAGINIGLVWLVYLAGGGLWSVPGGLAGALLFCGGAYSRGIKNSMLRLLEEDSPITASDLGSFPGCDAESIAAATRELEDLGFVLHGDFEQSGSVSVLLRVFVHPQHDCLAVISQVLQAGQALTAAAVAIWSFFRTASLSQQLPVLHASRTPIAELDPGPAAASRRDTRENWYIFASSNAKLNWLSRLYRHEHMLGNSVPDAPLRHLLEIHLQQRQIVVERIGCTWDTGDIAGVFLAFQIHFRRLMLARMRRRPGTIIVWRSWRARKELEYWGDLGKLKTETTP